MDILYEMRNLKISKEKFELSESVEIVFEKVITKFGNSAKVDTPKKYIGKRAYVVIVND